MSDPGEHTREEITVLDIVLVLSKYWKMIIALPLVCAALVFVYTYVQPKTYSSEMQLNIGMATASRIRSEEVVRTALNSYSPQVDLDEVAEGLSLSPVNSQVTRVQLSLLDRRDVNEVLRDLVELIDARHKLAVEERIVAEEELLEAHDRQAAILRAGVDALLSVQQSRANNINDMVGGETQLQALSSAVLAVLALDERREAMLSSRQLLPASIILSNPTPPRQVGLNQPVLLAVLTAIAVGFALCCVVFVIEGVRNARSNPKERLKFEIIKENLFGKGR